MVVEAPDAKVKFLTKLSEDNPVKFAPDTAGNGLGNLASGIVPDERLPASNVVKSTLAHVKPPALPDCADKK